MNKLILFLLRKKLGLKKNQLFYFINQRYKSHRYYFDSSGIKKITARGTILSNLRINYLISDKCLKQIRRTDKYAE